MMNYRGAGSSIRRPGYFSVFLLATGLVFCTSSVRATATSTTNPASIPASSKIIKLSLAPARVSGVAPLAVFFDATSTTSDASVNTSPFHDLEYRWNFGDINAGNWKNGANPGVSSKNSAIGPVASHVFETPGTYVVSVTAFDGVNTATTSTTIQVQDPNAVFAGGNTICFSSSDVYTGCPEGAKHVQTSNFATAINTYQATNRRLLFRRGETFNVGSQQKSANKNTSGFIDKTGPGIVGAFGAPGDPRPVLKGNGFNQMLIVSSRLTPGIGDWRLMDLAFDGQSGTSGDNVGITYAGGFNQLLILRMDLINLGTGISAGPYGMDYTNNKYSKNAEHTIFEEWAVIDSMLRGIPGCRNTGPKNCDWRIYLAGKRISIQGNDLDNEDTGGTHVIRSEYMAKGVISNNRIARPSGAAHAIKLHARDWTTAGVTNPGGVGTYSEQVVISDNKIIGNTNAWTVSMGPQNDGTVPDQPADERVRDIIFERNWVIGGSGTQVSVASNAARATFRNNIIDTSSGKYQTAIAIGRRGTEPIPDNVRIYNNTLYSSSATSEYTAIKLGDVSNVTVKNNLAYAPLSSTQVMILGTPPGLVQSNNSTNAQIKNTFPGWVSATPSRPSDYRLNRGGYARSAGIAVPVYSDFFLQNRSSYDLGAVSR